MIKVIPCKEIYEPVYHKIVLTLTDLSLIMLFH